MENQNDKQRTQKLALAAILTALVAVLQFLGAFIHIGPFSVSLVLIPIVIGAALCGWQIGAWLGLVFGITVLLSGDASSFLAVSIPGTVGTVLVKGIACGAAAGIQALRAQRTLYCGNYCRGRLPYRQHRNLSHRLRNILHRHSCRMGFGNELRRRYRKIYAFRARGRQLPL